MLTRTQTAPAAAPPAFPFAGRPLPRVCSWRSGVLVSLGGILLVLVSAGQLFADLGSASWLVWGASALIGALQCLMIAEMATRFPDKAGGTATYIHEAFKQRWPFLGALANWSYWVGWTPGIAVNLVLAAQYIRSSVLPHDSVPAIALALLALSFFVAVRGLKASTVLLAVVAALAVIPLTALAGWALLHPGSLHWIRAAPAPPTRASYPLFAKWLFVAGWAAYGGEMASNVASEMRQPERNIPRAMIAAASINTLVYVLIPVLLLVMGGSVDGPDATAPWASMATRAFGALGAKITAVMLAASLVLGAQAFLVGSGRTLLEMARDSHTLAQLAYVSRRGVPIVSLGLDCCIAIALILGYSDRLVALIAAANVPYILVFILLPAAYLRLRKQPAQGGAFALPKPFPVIAAGLGAFNALLLIVGGWQWGTGVLLTGFVLTLLFCIPYQLRRGQNRRMFRYAAGYAPTRRPVLDTASHPARGHKREVAVHAKRPA